MDHDPSAAAEGPSLAEVLRRDRAAILADWQEAVRSLPPARELSKQEILDHLPHLLDRIAEMVEDLEAGRPIGDPGPAGAMHAHERLGEGWDLSQVVREFVALRGCVLDRWEKQEGRQASPLFHRVVDEAVSTAVQRYSAARERTLVALDRIAAAALAARDLTGLLSALTRVLLETTLAVDSVAIYLKDGDFLAMRAAAGLEEPLAGKERVPLGMETCAGRVAITEEPLEVRDAAQSPLVSGPLRKHGARALYAAPMRHDGQTIGVAHIASCSAFEFSRQDKLLFHAMVERATQAIVQRQLQEALEAERRRLAAVLDALPVAVWVVDANGRLLRTNPAVDALWGSGPVPRDVSEYAQFRGTTADGRTLGPEDWPAARAVRGETVAEEDARIVRFDGTTRDVLMSARPIRGPGGELAGAAIVNLDITERKRAEKARRESEEAFRTLADSIPQLVWIADPDGWISWYNRRWYDYTGTAPEEMAGWGWQKVHHPDHLERIVAHYRACIEGGVVWEDEFPLRAADGSWRWFLSRAVPVKDAAGRIVRWFGTNTDVTEQKESRAAMQRAFAMLDALFVSAPVGLAFFDRELRYLRINETLARVNGPSPEAHVGKRVRDILPDKGEAVESVLRRVLETGVPELRIDVSLATPAEPERVRDWQLSIAPVRLADGGIVGLGAVAVDVTDLKQALKARDEFLSVASHDLRSPLTAIQLQVALMRRKAADGTDLESAWAVPRLDKVLKQIERVGALVSDLLDVSRIQAGRVNLAPEEMDFAALVRDVAIRHVDQLAQNGCALRLEAAGAVQGRWDPLRLEQIVTNLLSNAAKYGAGHPVEVTVSATGSKVLLSVQDHGVGIKPEDQDKIFQRFERVGDREAFAGTGLGLWICRKFVDAMHGRLWVESEPGKGATFFVELPRG